MVWLDVAAAVVADDAADVFGDGVEVVDEVIGRFGGQIGVVGQRAVDVGDVGLVVLVVVQLHGRCVDKGLERGVVVGKGCKFVSHGDISSDENCTVMGRSKNVLFKP